MVTQQKYISLDNLNSRILNFPYSPSEALDKPQIIDRKWLQDGKTFAQSAASMKNLITTLPFIVVDFIPKSDKYWVNFLRCLQITLLSLSPVASDQTLESLQCLIAIYSKTFQELYPDETFKPKLHYLVHFPSQLRDFGPLRGHWCMRFEAKMASLNSNAGSTFKTFQRV